jgi:membrane-associated HD superfamily phosphohydrolase
MDKKLRLPERKRNWKITLALLLVCVVLLAAVFSGRVGCESGDLLPTGMLLTYTATAALVLAFVHCWRRAWKFLVLAVASLAGFFLFVLLENLSYALGQMAADASLWRHLGEFFHGFFFCIAVLVCPAGLFVGVVGSFVVAAVNFRKRQFVGR